MMWYYVILAVETASNTEVTLKVSHGTKVSSLNAELSGMFGRLYVNDDGKLCDSEGGDIVFDVQTTGGVAFLVAEGGGHKVELKFSRTGLANVDELVEFLGEMPFWE